MTKMEDTIKLLQPYKGKTVEEVIAILQKKEQKINNKQSLAQQKKMEWYKGCIGKYYKIQYSSTTFMLVHIKKGKKPKTLDNYQHENNPYSFLAWECYFIQLSDRPKIESNSGFCVTWLCNPYESSRPSNTCIEISKEEFERITSPFNSLINEAKQILTK